MCGTSAKSTGQLAKTDRQDARVLAHLGEADRPSIRPLRDADTQILSAVLARRRQVSSIIAAEKKRLSRAIPEVSPRIQVHASWLEQELDDLDDNQRMTVRNSSVWREKDQFLRSVPRVGNQVSITLLADLPELGTLSRKNKSLPSAGTAVPIVASAMSAAAVLAFMPCCVWGTCRQSLESGNPRVLLTAAGCRRTPKAGFDGLYAEALGYTQLHAGKRSGMESGAPASLHLRQLFSLDNYT